MLSVGRAPLFSFLLFFLRSFLSPLPSVSRSVLFHQPENVFVGEDDCLKIGDFGLSRTEATMAAAAAAAAESEPEPEPEQEAEDATGAQRSPRFPPASAAQEAEDLLDPLEAAIVPRRPSDPSSEGHTTGVGTASYASPEQLQGHQYGVRSDLFSLGLVLLELCCRFTTTHERAAAFQSMRRQDGAAPCHLAERSPAIAQLAELLCRTVPEQRPSAAEVLERLDALDGHCGCPGCPGGGRGVQDSKESGDVRLREELAAKTRKVEEQVLYRRAVGVSRSLGCRVFVIFFVCVCCFSWWSLLPGVTTADKSCGGWWFCFQQGLYEVYAKVL